MVTPRQSDERGWSRERNVQNTNSVVVIALILTITNTLAFSRCDKFGHASNLAGSAFSTGNLAGTVASGMVSRFFTRG